MIFILCWGIFVGGGYAVARLAPGWGLSGPWALCTLYIITLGIVLGWHRAPAGGDESACSPTRHSDRAQPARNPPASPGRQRVQPPARNEHRRGVPAAVASPGRGQYAVGFVHS